MDISISVDNLPQLRAAYSPELVVKAIGISTQRTTAKLRTQVSKAVRRRYNVPAGEIASTARIRRANVGVAGRVLLYTGMVVPLKRFGARKRNVQTKKGKRRGVSVQVRKDKLRQVVAGAFIVNPFGKGIFRRRGKGRGPLGQRFGPSVPQMVDDVEVIDAAEAFVGQEYPRQFETNMTFLINKAAGRL